jgi:hypothetical protein
MALSGIDMAFWQANPLRKAHLYFFRNLGVDQANDCIMLDVMKIGDVTGRMRAAALGEAHGIRLSSHLWPEISAQIALRDPDGALAGVQRLVESSDHGTLGS